MYSPKISEDQIKRLYRLKISLLAAGQRNITMTGLVEEALEKYLRGEEMKIQTGKDRTYNFLIKPTDKEIAAESR